MNRLRHNALLIAGYSESRKVAEPTREALLDLGMFSSVKVMPLSDAVNNPLEAGIAAAGNTVLWHSAGGLVVDKLLQKNCPIPGAIAICGAEPTKLRHTMYRATKLGGNDKKAGAQIGVALPSLTDGAKELSRSPRHALKTPLAVRSFSSSSLIADKILDNTFEDGGAAFYAKDDEFRFACDIDIEHIKEAIGEGMIVDTNLPGGHNRILFWPEEVVGHIQNVLDT